MSPLTPEPSSPLYQTDLAQTPLAEILAKIHRYKAPGRIECRRGDERLRIYVEHGQIIFAKRESDADPIADTLTGDALFAAMRTHIEEIIWSVFTWGEGTASFTPGRNKNHEFIRTEIAIPRAVLNGVLRMPDARAVVTRLGGRTTIFEHTAGEVDPLTLEPDELRLYEAVDGRRALGDLVAIPPLSSADNARLMYAFFLLGMIAPRSPRPLTIKVNIEGKNGD